MDKDISKRIYKLRKSFNLSQEKLASKIGVSFQAVSKWENGISHPDIDILPKLAEIFHVSLDYLILGDSISDKNYYEKKYEKEEFYWGLQPSKMCYEILKLMPPTKKYKLLNVGCGEGKDSIFLARNGYDVTCFDCTNSGIEKVKNTAERLGININAFVSDICEFRLKTKFDIIIASGMINSIPEELRKNIFKNYKEYTNANGLNAFAVFVEKPFNPSNHENVPNFHKWYSGDLLHLYHDWKFEINEEILCDCKSKHLPHPHAISTIIARKQV